LVPKKSAPEEKKTTPTEALENILEQTKDFTKSGLQIGKTTVAKLDESVKKGIRKTDPHSLADKTKVLASNTVRTISTSNKQEIQKNTRKTISQIKTKSLSVFEEFVGTIRKGTQYGKTSITMLAELAKMKELGIITNEEFELKKKQILERI
jgi:1,4-alpha-glucan branching enzyme